MRATIGVRREVCRSTATVTRVDGDSLLLGFMRRDSDFFFGQIASLSREFAVSNETAHALVGKGGESKERLGKLGNAEGKSECMKLMTGNWRSMMIRRGFVFEETLNEAIDVPVEDEESPSSEPQGSPCDSYVDAAIAAEQVRQENDGTNASGSGHARGQELLSLGDGLISECAEDKKVKFAAAILRGPALTWWNSKVTILGLDVANQMGWTKMKKLMTTEFYLAEELQRMENDLWNLKVKEYNMVAYTQRFNELALMCPRMVEPESVKIDAYI
ncbi:putative reverse transcriptase domain-containing protein [Tanacetum coccineum]